MRGRINGGSKWSWGNLRVESARWDVQFGLTAGHGAVVRRRPGIGPEIAGRHLRYPIPNLHNLETANMAAGHGALKFSLNCVAAYTPQVPKHMVDILSYSRFFISPATNCFHLSMSDQVHPPLGPSLLLHTSTDEQSRAITSMTLRYHPRYFMYYASCTLFPLNMPIEFVSATDSPVHHTIVTHIEATFSV